MKQDYKDNIDRIGKIQRIQIEEYLKSKGVVVNAFDYLIDMFIIEFAIYHKAVNAIEQDGLLIAGNGENTFFVKNPNITTKNECLKNIQSISKQLGLSVYDSQIFKILNEGIETDDDGFDAFKN